MTGSLSSSFASTSSSSQATHRTFNRRRQTRSRRAATAATLLLSSTSYIQSALAAPQPQQLIEGTHRILTPEVPVPSPTVLASASTIAVAGVAQAQAQSSFFASSSVAAASSASASASAALPSASSASSGGLAGLPAASAAQYGASEALSQIFGQEIQQQIDQAIAFLQASSNASSSSNLTSSANSTVAQDSLLADAGANAQTQSFAQAIKAAVAHAVASVVASIDNSAALNTASSTAALPLSTAATAATTAAVLPTTVVQPLAQASTLVQPSVASAALSALSPSSTDDSTLSAASSSNVETAAQDMYAPGSILKRNRRRSSSSSSFPVAKQAIEEGVYGESEKRWLLRRWWEKRALQETSVNVPGSQAAPSVASSSRSTVSEDAMPSVYVAFATVTVTDTETLTQTKTTTPSASSSANQASSERRSSSSVVPSIVFGSPTVARGGAEFKPTPFSGSVTSIGYSTASPVLAAVHSVVPSLAIPPGAQSQQAVTGSAAASAASAASLASARNAAIASQRPLGSLTGTNGGHVQGVAPVQNDASSSKASSSSTAKASSQTAQATSGTLGSLTGTNGGLAPAPANDVNSVTTASSKSTAKSSSTSQSKTSTSSQPAATVTPGSSLGSLTGTNGGFAGNLSSPSPAGDNIVSDVIDSLGTTVGAVVSTKSSSSTQRPATTSAAIPKSSSTAIIKSSSSSTAKSSSTAPASTAVPQPAGDSQSQSQVLIGYWPDWTVGQLPPESIDFTKYDIVFYAFALPTSNFGLEYNYGDATLLKRLVKAAHAGGSKVVLSIGGWGGSTYFSPAVRTDATRQQFITSILKEVKANNIDGLDFDWEYPYGTGAGNNQLDPNDTANFQTFLQQLRAQMPSPKIISAAVAHQPWTASNGKPVNSVARAASALDYIMIMNYDVWGSSSNPGPNAPLANLCGNSTQPAASAAAAVKQWSAAGMPRSKMLLGVPAYGYVSTSSAKSLIQRDQVGEEGHYLPSAHRKPANVADVPSGRAGRYNKRLLSSASQLAAKTLSEGQNNFNLLVSSGALKKNAAGSYVAGTGWTRKWDSCSDTPFLYNGQQVITYDDPSSISDKGQFARETGLAGVGIWSIDADTSDLAIASAAINGMAL